MTAERIRPHNWDQLSPEVQAAVDRELDRIGPVRWDPEHCRRLAALLGLGPRVADAVGAEKADAADRQPFATTKGSS